jgi:ribosomal protein RSM22 (predicted rRNA methylase)
MRRFTPSEIATLRRLRAVFLSAGGQRNYWDAESDLALYDATFGARIGWKWNAVLRELSSRHWRPRSRHLFDWGCGSGVAMRAALSAWPGFSAVTARDRSPLSEAFTRVTVSRNYPDIAWEPDREIGGDTLVLISHVMNELSDAALESLIAASARACELIWVESAAHQESRRLLHVRGSLLENAGFRVVAPCTHQFTCGLLTAENARHWCHHFAQPPPEVFHDAGWTHFSRELGIDLRRTPYSFLTLERADNPAAATTGGDLSRVIGLPRHFKGYSKVLSCQAAGVTELMLQKRDARELFEAVRDPAITPIYRWAMAHGKIVGGAHFEAGPPKQHG